VTPDHQPEGMANWVYPSQQQYYNAMKVTLSAPSSCPSYSLQRKGYNPDERDVEIILAIHNIVNEKGLSPPSSL
jgi:cytochrome c heme-lyase